MGAKFSNHVDDDTLVAETPTPSNALPPAETPVLAAIDIGTTHSGFAYMFRDNPDHMHIGPDQDGKVPSALLLNGDETFHSFGKTAIDVYNQLDHEKGEQNGYYHFHHFPRYIIQQEKETMIIDQSGRRLPALTVYTRVLKYFSHQILSKIGHQYKDHITWIIVITIKYIESFNHKFLEATATAGLGSDKVRLVYASEAVALYCKHTGLLSRQNYVVANLGGGGIRVDAHQPLPSGGFRELHGKYHNCKDTNWVKKDNYYLDQQLAQILGPDSSETRPRYEQHHCLTSQISTDLLEGCLEAAQECISNVLSECQKHNITTLYVVGGLSESPYIQQRIRGNFRHLNVVTVEKQGLTVLKGTLLMGLKPRYMKERINQQVYGFAHDKHWGKRPTKSDKLNLKENTKGEVQQTLVQSELSKEFFKILDKGDILAVPSKFSRSVKMKDIAGEFCHKAIVSELWMLDRDGPQCCSTGENCRLVLQGKIAAPHEGWPDKVAYEEILEITHTALTLKIKVLNNTTY